MASNRDAESAQPDLHADEIIAAFRTVGEIVARLMLQRLEAPRNTHIGAKENLPLLLNRGEAATMLGVSGTSVDRMRHQGVLKTVSVGSRIMFARDELERIGCQSVSDASSPAAAATVVENQRLPVASKAIEGTSTKSFQRKPNAADHYAQEKYELNLRELKISGPILQSVMGIDAIEYKKWAYGGEELPEQAMIKFDVWCTGMARSVREMAASRRER
jgi:hypothetical protein